MSQSLRKSLNIPACIPEGMVHAIADVVARKNANAITNIIDPRQDVIREKIRVAPGSPTSVLLDKCGFQNKNGIYPDFFGSNVLDIGGGFGGIAPILSNSAFQIVVVDPIFNEKNLESLYLADLSGMENRIHLQFDNTRPVSLELAKRREKNTANAKKVYEEVLWWKTYDSLGRHRHIQRNPSYGENLVGISSNSQDYIFVNYVLLKTTVHSIEFLNEMNRVIKRDGKIIISDSEMPQEILSLVQSRFEGITIIQNNREGFIGSGKKG